MSSTSSRDRVFGPFILRRELGRGGMGIVYEATAPDRSEPIALKLMHPVVSLRPCSEKRFERESRVAIALAHEHIVPIYDYGTIDDCPYIAMPLIRGGNLGQHPLESIPTEIERMIAIARAIGYAHDHNVIHRDLKPSNILLGENGHAYVADFGLATHPDSTKTLTESNTRLGTLRYMAPEQADGQGGSVRADVYALGAILFERVCGCPLYDEGPDSRLLLKVLVRAVPNLAVLATQGDGRLQLIIETCLHRHPEDRYPDCHALVDDLERWQRGEKPAATKPGVLKKGWRWVSENPRRTRQYGLFVLLALFCCTAVAINMITASKMRIVEYFQLIDQAETEMIEGNPGWKSRTTSAAQHAADLEQRLDGGVRQTGQPRLQSILANVAFGFDIGTPTFQVQHENTSLLRFHPSKPWLFIGAKLARDADQDCRILVVDTASGQVVNSLSLRDAADGERSGIVEMVLVGDDHLAAVTRAGHLQVFSVASMQDPPLGHQVDLPIRHPVHVVYAKAHHRLIVTGHDGQGGWQIVAFDTNHWEQCECRAWDRGISSIVADEEGRKLYLSEADQLARVNPLTLERELAVPGAVGLIASDRQRLAMLRRRSLSIYNSDNLKLVGEVQAPSSGFATSYWNTELQFSPRGDLLVLSDRERNQIHLFSTTDYRHLQTVVVENTVYRNVHFAISPDQQWLASTGGVTTSVAPILSSSLEQLQAGVGEIQQAAFSRDSGVLAVLTDTAQEWHRCELFVLELPPQQEGAITRAVCSLEQTPRYVPASLAVSPDGSHMASLIEDPEWSQACIAMYDATTLQVLGRTKPLAAFRSMVFGDDGSLFIAANSGVMHWTDFSSESVTEWKRGVNGPTMGGTKFPTIASCRDRLLLGDEDGYFTSLSWPTPAANDTSRALGNTPLLSFAMHETKDALAIGDGNGTITILDPRTGTTLAHCVSAHQAAVPVLAWTSSDRLISAGKDQKLYFWAWDAPSKTLKHILGVEMRGNIRQLFPVPGTANEHYDDELILLREGAFAIERWQPPKSAFRSESF